MVPSSWSVGAREAPAPAGVAAVQERPEPLRAGGTLQGRVAVVTGGATGLGRSVALEFAQQGCGVAFNYLDLPGRDVAEQALGERQQPVVEPPLGLLSAAASRSRPRRDGFALACCRKCSRA